MYQDCCVYSDTVVQFHTALFENFQTAKIKYFWKYTDLFGTFETPVQDCQKNKQHKEKKIP